VINPENDNPEQNLAFGFLQYTSENVFLTGNAGTGKTTFLRNLRKHSPKRMVVLAPTGVAAINAGGVTIHSFFQMPFGPWVPDTSAVRISNTQPGKRDSGRYHRFSREKLNIVRSLDLIVIDEVSMVRADLLDGIDEQLRRIRKNDMPFGGVQLLLIGDLQQLAPVIKDDEWEILKQYYDTPFFFGSRALQRSNYITIELKKIYRQTDQKFIDLLNKIRYSDKNPDTLNQLNRRYQPGLDINTEGCIILTTHNYQAKRINEERMRKLPGKSHKFTAKIEGEFPEYSYPTDFELEIKTGSQVMFIKNDSSQEKRFFNGKIGKVEAIENDMIYVNCPDDKEIIKVGPETWQNIKYELNHETNEIVETEIGSFIQYPIKAAWAITIHKSQGLTFDKVIIDAGAAFAHGQIYVALSRCKTLEGLNLTSPISPRVLISDSSVSQFTRNIQNNQPGELQLKKASLAYQQKLLKELFDFSALYRQINYFLKLINQSREDILQNTILSLNRHAASAKAEIFDVSEKFDFQIISLLSQEPDVEKNEQLKERIKKAVPYFIQKVQTSIGSFLLSAGEIKIDNKEIIKSFADSIKKLNDLYNTKISCLEACRENFSIGAFLKARSEAAIEKPVSVKDTQSNTISDENSHPSLFRKLRHWRSQMASHYDCPEYMILNSKTIVEICTRLPSSLKELKSIKGIGKSKLKVFGSQILDIIESYCRDANIQYSINKDLPEERQKIKLNTRQISLDLFKEGKTLQEIAAHRNLTLSTIEEHMSHFITTGELSIDQFMPAEKVSEIIDYFLTHESRKISVAKEHFGDKVSYGELRLVIAHLSCFAAEDDKVYSDSVQQ